MFDEDIVQEIYDFTFEKIREYGSDNQLIVAIEELSELQKEITKHIRRKGLRENLIEEFADVQLMLLQIKVLFKIGDNEIENAIRYKMNREREKN